MHHQHILLAKVIAEPNNYEARANIMPAWMTYVMNHDIMRFAQFAVRVWGCKMDFSDPDDGKTGGFMQLSSKDIAEIYKLAL